MGAEIGEADGDSVCLLDCGQCQHRYETDETTTNDCPHCGWVDFEVVATPVDDPEKSWRDDDESG